MKAYIFSSHKGLPVLFRWNFCPRKKKYNNNSCSGAHLQQENHGLRHGDASGKLVNIQSGSFFEYFIRLQIRGMYHGIDLNCESSLKFTERVKPLIFYSPNCTQCVSVCLTHFLLSCLFLLVSDVQPLFPGVQLPLQHFPLVSLVHAPRSLLCCLKPHVHLPHNTPTLLPALSRLSLESGAWLSGRQMGQMRMAGIG